MKEIALCEFTLHFENWSRGALTACCFFVKAAFTATVAASDIYDGPIMPLANRLLERIKWSQYLLPSSEDRDRAQGECKVAGRRDTHSMFYKGQMEF